ncbi:1,4-dihydroxy-2-naphthoate octaprenyltransferase [Insulibacter thermoxylanivorax]|uniref:1,4-dihydroxy-2-naphthoate octaprenyltransferase n=1 Tax=Insulibacter thermoxylanivorax TaxID=2749268 RepID=A0A916QHD0_9BACL|nr:1,4-dihydroxy-2-naphthoate polyprenyltransferase [Insulibacter thermoxylanivorax]GFR39478.1 1,4-dihydroxy-2-naphthoate octaprenyltransferase [Insulibacter thermoxylanivorax]
MQIQVQSTTASAQVWWRLMRPHTLTASFVPVFIGTAMALFHNQLHIPLFIAMLTASVLVQAATNMINEYFDYVRGLDNEHSVGIGGTIVRDGVSPRTVRNLAILFYLFAVAIGVYICMESSWWVAAVGSLSILVSYLYSAGPIPISSTPLGELFSGLFMGPVIIMITYYIQTGMLTMDFILLSISVGLLIGAINLSNNIRDLDGDKEHGRKTLAILLGRPRAIKLLAAIFTAAFIITIALVFLGIVTPWVLLVIFSIPKAIQAVRQFQGKTLPYEMMPAMRSTAQLNTIFGLLLTAGLVIGFFTHS